MKKYNNPANQVKAHAKDNDQSYWDSLGLVYDVHDKKTERTVKQSEEYQDWEAKRKNIRRLFPSFFGY